MVLRKSYLDKIIPFIDQDLIKVLVGIRRCGKTVLLGQIKDVLLQRNIPAQNIIPCLLYTSPSPRDCS